jgi:transposase
VNDWAEIRHLSKSQGLSGRQIAARLGVSRQTVRRALASDGPPKYVRESSGSKVDPYLPQIKALLIGNPGLKATVIAERVGFNQGVCTSVFRAKVRELKQQLGVVDPVDRLVFTPGEQVQCDLWFPDTRIEATGVTHPVLTMVACWSRFLLAVMIPTRTCGDILAGMNILLGRLGGLPERLLWDNEAGLVHQRKLIPQASAWAGAMGASVKLAKPKDPETKGRIERANGYLGSSFAPARRFTDISDFNRQLDEWLDQKANQRFVRATGAKPADMLFDERMSLDALPEPPPPAAITATIRLGRDYHVRIAGCDYSVSPAAIGRIITIQATLTRVEATCDGVTIADHPRCLTPHQTITDPSHVAQAAQLRAHYQNQHRHLAANPPRHLVAVENRDLASYDQLWQDTTP